LCGRSVDLAAVGHDGDRDVSLRHPAGGGGSAYSLYLAPARHRLGEKPVRRRRALDLGSLQEKCSMTTIALGKARKRDRQEEVFIATQWTLMWRKFRRHKLAMAGTAKIIVLYLIALFCEFVASQDPVTRDTAYTYVPPQRLHFFGE